jgi:hypothetical protein
MIDLIVPAALWPWDLFNLNRDEYHEAFCELEGDRNIGKVSATSQPIV